MRGFIFYDGKEILFMLLNSLLSDEAKWYLFLTDTPHDLFRTVAIWLTFALTIAFVATVLIAKVLKAAWLNKFLKASLVATIVYSFVVAVTSLVFNFREDSIVPILFIPILILIVAIAVSGVLLAFFRNKPVIVVAAVLTGGALVATLVCMGIHFASGDAAELNWLTNEDVNTLGLYVSAALTVIAVVYAAFLFDRNNMHKQFDSKSISYAAICIAMSFALSYLRIVKMPQGGSITIASLLPLMIYSYMFGTRKGTFAGMIYGILQAFQDNYIIHPAQFLLDYPVAFACIGLAGMFAGVKALEKMPQVQFALGAIVAGLARFLIHFLSGIFAFGAFAPEGTPVALYSFTYQAGYVLPDIAIVIIVGILLFSAPSFVSMARQIRAKQA